MSRSDSYKLAAVGVQYSRREGVLEIIVLPILTNGELDNHVELSHKSVRSDGRYISITNMYRVYESTPAPRDVTPELWKTALHEGFNRLRAKVGMK